MRIAFLFMLLVALMGAPAGAQTISNPPIPYKFTANATYVFNIDGMGTCSVVTDATSTMGSGTITVKTSPDNGGLFTAVTGYPDPGATTSPAQTITAAGKVLYVPVIDAAQIELVLSGSTSPTITGHINCVSAPMPIP